MAGSKPDNSALAHMHCLALPRWESKSRASGFRPPVVRSESARPVGKPGARPGVRVRGVDVVDTWCTEMIEPAKRTCAARARPR